jgi:hypothetical protein
MSKTNNGANLGFENQMWAAADKLRGHMDASEYKHVVLGLIASNTAENETLSSLRDTLLPKLISGELRVPAAENFVGEVGI